MGNHRNFDILKHRKLKSWIHHISTSHLIPTRPVTQRITVREIEGGVYDTSSLSFTVLWKSLAICSPTSQFIPTTMNFQVRTLGNDLHPTPLANLSFIPILSGSIWEDYSFDGQYSDMYSHRTGGRITQTREIRNNRWKTCPSALSQPQMPHLEMNADLRGQKFS